MKIRTKVLILILLTLMAPSLTSCQTKDDSKQSVLPSYIIQELNISLELLTITKSTKICEDILSDKIQRNIEKRMIILKNLDPKISTLSLPEVKTLHFIILNQELFHTEKYQSFLMDIAGEIIDRIENNSSKTARDIIQKKYGPKAIDDR